MGRADKLEQLIPLLIKRLPRDISGGEVFKRA